MKADRERRPWSECAVLADLNIQCQHLFRRHTYLLPGAF